MSSMSIRRHARAAAAAVLTLAVTAATSAAAVPATTLVPANLRATPQRGKVLARIPAGTRVVAQCTRVGARGKSPVDGVSRLWIRVTVRGRPGWIHDGFLNPDQHLLLAPICEVPVATAPAVGGTQRGYCAIRPVVALIPPFATREAFIAAALPGARASRDRDRVPVSVTLAQALLESDGGRIAALGNNFFGIKAKAPDPAGTYYWGPNAVGCTYKKTSEGEADGLMVRTYDAFRAYPSLSASIMDHGALLTSNPVYAPAFAFTDRPRRFALEIGRRYATDPGYVRKVFDIMARYDLEQYDPPPPPA